MRKDPFFGINVSLEYIEQSNLDEFIGKIDHLDCGWVRLEFDWYTGIDQKKCDRFIFEMTRRRISILGLLTGIVPGTFKNIFFPHLKFKSPVTYEKDFLKFCSKICKRYSGYIDTWEIWNEENTTRFWIKSPEPDEYASLLRNSIQAIRRIQPKAKIIIGGIFGNDVDTRFSTRGYLSEVLDQIHIEDIDVLAFHPYDVSCYISFSKKKEQYLDDAKKDIDKFIKTHRPRRKEIWVTEYGISSGYTLKMDDKDIGWVYAGILKHCRKKGIILFIWNMTDMHSDKYSYFNPERVFGLLDSDMNPKDIYRILSKKRDAEDM